MAGRNSKSLSLSGSKSGVLNEDSSVIDSEDSSWFNRTAIRSSTSQNPAAQLEPSTARNSSEALEKNSKQSQIDSAPVSTAASINVNGSSRTFIKPGPKFTKTLKNVTNERDDENLKRESASGKIAASQSSRKSAMGNEFDRQRGKLKDRSGNQRKKVSKASYVTPASAVKYRGTKKRPAEDQLDNASSAPPPFERFKDYMALLEKSASQASTNSGPDIDCSTAAVVGSPSLLDDRMFDKTGDKVREIVSPEEKSQSSKGKSTSANSSSQKLDHSRYRIAESSSDEEDIVVVPRERRKAESGKVSRTRTQTARKSKNVRYRRRLPMEAVSLSFFDIPTEHEKSKEAENAGEWTLGVESPVVQNRTEEEVSKHDDSNERQQLPSIDSDEDIYTPSASRSKSTSRSGIGKDDSNSNASHAESSSTRGTSERIQELRKRVLGRSRDSNIDDVFEDMENVPEDASASSHTSRESHGKSAKTDGTSKARDALARKSLSNVAQPIDPTDIEKSPEKRQPTRRRSPVISGSIKTANDRQSPETPSNSPALSPLEASTPKSPPGSSAPPSKRTPARPSFDFTTLSSPRPLGRPWRRLRLFSSDYTDDSDEERVPVTAAEVPKVVSRAFHDDDEDDDGVFDESQLATHLRRFLNPPTEEMPQSKSTIQTHTSIDWAVMKKETDAAKARALSQLRRSEEERKRLELQRRRIDEGVQRLQARKEYRRKLRKRKPVDKAFLVDGKVYKQPKLPQPKPWVTDKLYKYLWKCMERKCGLRTRVKSERFVVKLAEFATMIAKRKKYEKYAAELEDLMRSMAKFGIIETRYDFCRFCSDFMPYSFREKVCPIAIPGNRITIPYDPALVFTPIWDGTNEQEDESDSSDD